MIDVRVLGSRVLVALPPEEEEQTTASGLVLVKDPDILRTPTRGIVVQLGEKTGTVDIDEVFAVLSDLSLEDGEDWHGPLKRLGPAPFDVQIGDCVLFSPGSGSAFTRDGIEYVILTESELLGVVEPEQKDEVAA